jgi:acyl-CoA synthetase (AMP-forming)/AMP-acid ligase II
LADGSGRTLTVAGYREAAEAVAAGLAAGGVGPASVVSWQLPTTIEAAVLIGALARLGAVQQPVLPLLGERELAHLTALAGTTLLVVPSRFNGVEYEARGRRVAAEQGFEVMVCDAATGGALGLPTGDADALASFEPTPRARRWLYSTSGTTADPKGVWHTDASIVAGGTGFVDSTEAGPGDVYPIAFPIAHIGGAVMLAAALRCGHELVLFDHFDPATTPIAMAEHQPTILGSALPFLRAYLAAQSSQREVVLFPRLRLAMSGGAPKPAGLHAAVRDTLGGVGVMSSWGLTEFPLATFSRMDDSDEALATTEGHPVDGVELIVVDGAGGECEPGREGELRLKGPQLLAGYADPSADAAAFDERGFFRTGDLGVVQADGSVRITGRLKDVIIRNAENISASEVEEVLATHPGIADVAVIGLPDARTGERACCVVVVRDGVDVSLEDVSEHCRAAGLARFKHPEQLVVVAELPRSGMGKVAKQQLRAQILAAR